MAKKEWPQKWKDSAAKYNNEHYSVIGAKLTREKADQFRTLCKRENVSVSAALSAFVRAAIKAGTLDIIRDDIPGRENADQQTD